MPQPVPLHGLKVLSLTVEVNWLKGLSLKVDVNGLKVLSPAINEMDWFKTLDPASCGLKVIDLVLVSFEWPNVLTRHGA